ncbi:ATP-grasp domain-containing protein [Streptomyces beijiangensis]|uniref:ATP-grasp domain-containing protein n=1 Tax=Streptomyces beijiangensis TaxID=163361 RepID=A0A939FA69_9ACTN|nr:ATP-grasp domain-containing protein [Streptomyces beijiangensis]MBO0514358.1 ATP-grasp domain-containing protein [Streptomyces beijiangensis]
MDRIAVVYDLGSAGVMDIAAALENFATPVFVCPDSTDPSQPKELMNEFGILCDITGLDLGQAVERIRDYNPKGIVTFSEHQLGHTADLAQELGLAFHSPHTVQYLTQKHVQRTILNSIGASSVMTRIVEDKESALRAFEEVGAPSVLKPNQGSGSRSTYPIRSVEDLVRACGEIFPRSALGRSELFVLEQEMDGVAPGAAWGDYVSVETAVHDHEITHLEVTGKFPLAEPFRETGSFMPAALSMAEREDVLEVASLALKALGVRHGVCHTEVKLTERGPQVIEVNGRLGGRVHELLADSKGINAIEIAVRIAMGDTGIMRNVGASPRRRVSFLYAKLPPLEATRMVRIEGTGNLQLRPEISRVIVHQEPGHNLDWRDGRLGNTYVCYGATQTHEDLSSLIADIEETVRVTYE